MINQCDTNSLLAFSKKAKQLDDVYLKPQSLNYISCNWVLTDKKSSSILIYFETSKSIYTRENGLIKRRSKYKGVKLKSANRGLAFLGSKREGWLRKLGGKVGLRNLNANAKYSFRIIGTSPIQCVK